MTSAADGVTDDLFLGGRLRLRQLRRGHRAGHDAMLLAAAVRARSGQHVVEFGAGVGAAGLALAQRVRGLDLTLIEIDEALAALARHNAEANGIAAQVRVLDVGANAEAFAQSGLLPDSADAVLMNPPFHDEGRHRASPDAGRQLAHMATGDTLAQWLHSARRILKSGGGVTLIWRADGLGDALAALGKGFGSAQVLPVHPKPGTPAIRVLVSALKGGRAPLTIHPGLMLQQADGQGTPEAQAVLAGTGALPMATGPNV